MNNYKVKDKMRAYKKVVYRIFLYSPLFPPFVQVFTGC